MRIPGAGGRRSTSAIQFRFSVPGEDAGAVASDLADGVLTKPRCLSFSLAWWPSSSPWPGLSASSAGNRRGTPCKARSSERLRCHLIVVGCAHGSPSACVSSPSGSMSEVLYERYWSLALGSKSVVHGPLYVLMLA